MTEKTHILLQIYIYTCTNKAIETLSKNIKIKGNVLELHIVHNKGNTMTIMLPKAYTKN